MFDRTALRTRIRRLAAFRVPPVVRRTVPALLLVLAFLLPPVLVGGIGVALAMMASAGETPAALNQPLPARPTHDPARPTAVVVAGNGGTEVSDLLGPYETLAASGAFNVYVAAPERRPAPLYPGDLTLVPHYSFAEYDAAFGEPPALVVVPYIPDAQESAPEVLTWIRQQAARGTTILSICAGAEVVADAGVLDGQAATTHRDWVATLEQTHPEVRWVRGQRYVDSGQFISSAGVTSGVDATLYTLSRMFGREVADRTAATIGYPHTRFLDDPTWTNDRLRPLPYLAGAYRLDRDEIGLLLYEGVRELEVDSVVDTYPRSFVASVRTVSNGASIVRTRHGLDLAPRADLATAPTLDRLLVPGDASASKAAEAIQVWTRQHPDGPAVELIHASSGYLYDQTLRDMARHDGNSVVIGAANSLEYPTRDLALDGPAWRLDLLIRPLALGLLGLGAALWLRRRPRPGIRNVGRFALHFGEVTLAMMAGRGVFRLAMGGHGAATSATASAVHEAGMVVFMTVPMVAWMRLRGHSWRHGTEMAVGMLAPAVVIYVLLGLGASETLPWLQGADHPAMLLGMVGAMLLRREHYTGGHAQAAGSARRMVPSTT
jgi:transcriptional regulator GlxA family with amidase domain